MSKSTNFYIAKPDERLYPVVKKVLFLSRKQKKTIVLCYKGFHVKVMPHSCIAGILYQHRFLELTEGMELSL